MSSWGERMTCTTYCCLPVNFRPTYLGHPREPLQGIGIACGTLVPHRCPICPNHQTIRPIDPKCQPKDNNKFFFLFERTTDLVRWPHSVTQLRADLPLDQVRETWNFHTSCFVCWSNCSLSPMFVGKFCHRELIWASTRTLCLSACREISWLKQKQRKKKQPILMSSCFIT